MDVEVRPGSRLGGEARVPGDKSIAHRWLIFAATADGVSRITGASPSLDVRSTAGCLAMLSHKARPPLNLFARNDAAPVEGGGSTWNAGLLDPVVFTLEVEGEGRDRLVEAATPLDCGNSGTSMRLLAGIVAASPFTSVLIGDPSLSKRPMDRVAAPLRAMGARVSTADGHAPVEIAGGELRGIAFEPEVPTAQVKSAVLFAGLAAEGVTEVREPVPTRDHTERALAWLGAPITIQPGEISLRAYQHPSFTATVPGDPSSAAYLIAAAALTGSPLVLRDVGLNPSRLHFLDVMGRMGIVTTQTMERDEVGEPVGTIEVQPCPGITATRIEAAEVPLVVDEVPVLAALAVHAQADTWIVGAGELRVKESDRLAAIVAGLRALGGDARDEGDDLVIAAGGLAGGRVGSDGDHRIAMAMAVAALAARGPSRVDGIDVADVSFPGFTRTLRDLGASIEAV
jgi:3-phosphoshikimate 1-carboxyvinyltransferase